MLHIVIVASEGAFASAKFMPKACLRPDRSAKDVEQTLSACFTVTSLNVMVTFY